MTIKDMERQVGITRANIRFYEKEGLLSPSRSENNYRDYTEEDRAVLEKIKYLRLLGITVSDIRLFQQGQCSLSQLLAKREKQLEEEAAVLERLKHVCGALKNKDWDFKTFDTELFTLRLGLLERKEAETMKKDRISVIVSLKRAAWYLSMCGIASLVFFPVNTVLKIPVSNMVMTVWPLAVTLLAIAAVALQAAASGYEDEEGGKRKLGEKMVKRAEDKRLHCERQVTAFNQVCLASLFIIPLNRMLAIRWPFWLMAVWFVLVFGSAIAVAVVKNLSPGAPVN